MKTKHVYQVSLVRGIVWPNEDLVTYRTTERFSVKAAGQISAYKAVTSLLAESVRDQSEHLVSSMKITRVEVQS